MKKRSARVPFGETADAPIGTAILTAMRIRRMEESRRTRSGKDAKKKILMRTIMNAKNERDYDTYFDLQSSAGER